MRKLLNKLFCKKAIGDLEKENEMLKEKLQERQEVINQTNAYWKKKMYTLKKSKPSGRTSS